MRKLFLLLPALVLSLITNAAVININTETADALRKALNSATDGDIIEMAPVRMWNRTVILLLLQASTLPCVLPKEQK